eukprot:COSAG04_NODE_612_length_11991_cov_17.359569_8_plen_128_part_00
MSRREFARFYAGSSSELEFAIADRRLELERAGVSSSLQPLSSPSSMTGREPLSLPAANDAWKEAVPWQPASSIAWLGCERRVHSPVLHLVLSLAEVLSLIFALVSVYMTIFCFVGGQWRAVSQLWPA